MAGLRVILSQLRFLSLLGLSFYLLIEGSLAVPLSLTPHKTYKKKFKWSKIRRFFAKAQEELSSDLLDQIENAVREESKKIPNPIASTFALLHDGVDCSALRSDLHPNRIVDDVELRPSWIRRSKLIGDCPTDYFPRELPPNYYPPVILEAKCRCEDSQCSSAGHVCVPVKRNVPVWMRDGLDRHVLDVQELTVACACAKRTSRRGDNIITSFITS
ncbi:uncharacterized protein [Macrobrachium rosenbergii]|uniref:uncharacterized protein n=1 Tax=Macrobrachium rosenbergii TaxID=79674 RepID=UPI0034D79D70